MAPQLHDTCIPPHGVFLQEFSIGVSFLHFALQAAIASLQAVASIHVRVFALLFLLVMRLFVPPCLARLPGGRWRCAFFCGCGITTFFISACSASSSMLSSYSSSRRSPT